MALFHSTIPIAFHWLDMGLNQIFSHARETYIDGFPGYKIGLGSQEKSSYF